MRRLFDRAVRYPAADRTCTVLAVSRPSGGYRLNPTLANEQFETQLGDVLDRGYPVGVGLILGVDQLVVFCEVAISSKNSRIGRHPSPPGENPGAFFGGPTPCT